MKKIIVLILGVAFVIFTGCSDKFYEMRKSPCADYCLLEEKSQTKQG